MEVIGYVSTTMYYETMLDEVPNLEDWAVHDWNGNIPSYGGGNRHYYRWRSCYESRPYIDYIKKVLKYGIEEIGLDGFHFDNSRAKACCCPRCTGAFRQYLAENIPNPRQTVGLDHFRNVRIPPEIRAEEVHDTIVIWCNRFRLAQAAKTHKELSDYVHEIGGKYVLCNPGLVRPDFCTYVDVEIHPKSCDLMFAENNNYLRREDGTNYSQVLAFKMGERFGFKVFNAPWIHRDGNTAIPEDKDTIERYLCEGMIYGDITGAPWFIRSRKTADRVIIDDPMQRDIAKNAFDYFKANGDVYDAASYARVHLLYSTYSFYAMPEGAFEKFCAYAQSLTDRNVPYTVITDDQIQTVPAGDLIVLHDYRYAPVSQYEALAEAAKRGVRLLRIGHYGLYNENGKDRDHSNPIRDLRDVPNVLTELPEEFHVQIDHENVFTETRVEKNGTLVLHLLRPENYDTLQSVHICLKDARISAQSKPALHTIDEGCRIMDADITEDKAELKIANLRTMASIEFIGEIEK